MKRPGYIRFIDNKVKFEYHKLEKPNKDYYIQRSLNYRAMKLLKEYEASKRVIEVNNETCHFLTKVKKLKWILLSHWEIAKDNQPCEAEVENNIATIIKIN